MTNYLEPLSLSELATITKNLKTGIVKVLDLGDKALVPKDAKSCPPVGMLPIAIGMLEHVEAEILRRGASPSHPSFGPDILPEILDAIDGVGV